MNRYRLTALNLFTLLAAAATPPACMGQERQVTNAEELVSVIRENRERLGKGIFVIKAKCPVVPPNDYQYGLATRHYEVTVLASEGFRKFIMRFEHPQTTWTAKTLVKGDYIFVDPGESAPHANTGTLEGPENYRQFIFDPLALGIDFRPVLEMQRMSLSMALSRLLAAKSSSFSTSDDGTIVARYEFSEGSLNLSVDPSCGFGVVRTELQLATGAILDSVDSTYSTAEQEEGSPELWYPSTVVYRKFKGEEIVFQEDLAIDFRDVPALSEKEFELETLGLAEGRRVISGDIKAMMWRDGKLKQATGADIIDFEKGVYLPIDGDGSGLKKPQGGYFKTLLIVNAAAGTLIAIAAVMRTRSRRKRE